MSSIDALCGIAPLFAKFRHTRIARIAAVVAAIVALNVAGGWLAAQLNLQIWPQHSDIIELIIVAIVTLVDIGMNASLHDPNKVLELFMPLIDTNRAIAERYWRPSRSRGCPSKFARSTCNGRR